MLGPFLRIGRELCRQCPVLVWVAPSRPGAGNRPQCDLALLDPHQDLGRAANDVDVVAMQIVEIRRRIEGAEVAIGEKRIRCGKVEPPGEDCLKGVPRTDVLLDPAHVLLKAVVRIGPGRLRQRRKRLDLEWRARGRGCQTFKPALDPGLGFVEQPAQLPGACARRHFDVRDDGGAIEEVIEHQQGVRHHEDGVRKVTVVRGSIR
jgi:hypothetical protein